MQKNTICINCGSIGHRVYDCEEVNSFTIEMGWGRYNNHQITSPYCQESTPSYNYCQESSCTSKIFSLETYCSLHTLPNEQNHLKSLVKEQTNLSNIQEVTKFTTPWNNNCATIIIYQDNYSVFLGLIDRQANTLSKVKPNQIFIYPINPFETKWGIGRSRLAHNRIEDAEEEAQWLRTRMEFESNPILYVHPQANNYVRFDQLVKEPYVRIDYNASISDFKPLDIAWIERKRHYHHVGVCLGNDQIIEIEGGLLGSEIKSEGVKITCWRNFLDKKTGHLYRYHPIIPFKNYRTIIQQLVWAKDNNYGKNNYNLRNRNCQHFANSAVLGIDYSPEIEEKKHLIGIRNGIGVGVTAGVGTFNLIGSIALVPFTGGTSLLLGAASTIATIGGTVAIANSNEVNNNKGSTIKLIDEVKKTNGLNTKQDSETRELESRYEARIEQPIKISDCIIM